MPTSGDTKNWYILILRRGNAGYINYAMSTGLTDFCFGYSDTSTQTIYWAKVQLISAT
jgi:hypothetical protein